MSRCFTFCIMTEKEKMIWDLASQLLRILNKQRRIEDTPVGFGDDVVLSPREIHTVQMVGDVPGINITELGKRFGYTRSAASQMVKKLSAKGLIDKQPAVENNREMTLSLTDMGKKAYAAHQKFHEKHLREVMHAIKVFSVQQISVTSVLLDMIERVADGRLEE